MKGGCGIPSGELSSARPWHKETNIGPCDSEQLAVWRFTRAYVKGTCIGADIDPEEEAALWKSHCSLTLQANGNFTCRLVCKQAM